MENKNDIIVFNCLRENSRQKLKDICKSTKIPISTVYDILKRLKRDLIKKFTIIPNYYKLGYKTHAILILNPQIKNKSRLQSYLLLHPTINNFYMVDGNRFFIDFFAKDNKDLNNFMSLIEKNFNPLNLNVHFVLDEMKREDLIFNTEQVTLAK